LPSLDFEEQQKSFRIGFSFEGDSDIPIFWGQPSTYGPHASKRTSASTSHLTNALATSTPLNWSIFPSGYIFITHESESNSLLPSPIDLYDSINNEQTRIQSLPDDFANYQPRQQEARQRRNWNDRELEESLRDEGVVGPMLRLSQYMITFRQVRRVLLGLGR
jgi:hypothetical protein